MARVGLCFDEVVVKRGHGMVRLLPEEWLSLSVVQRAEAVCQRFVEFFEDGAPIPVDDALRSTALALCLERETREGDREVCVAQAQTGERSLAGRVDFFSVRPPFSHWVQSAQTCDQVITERQIHVSSKKIFCQEEVPSLFPPLLRAGLEIFRRCFGRKTATDLFCLLLGDTDRLQITFSHLMVLVTESFEGCRLIDVDRASRDALAWRVETAAKTSCTVFSRVENGFLVVDLFPDAPDFLQEWLQKFLAEVHDWLVRSRRSLRALGVSPTGIIIETACAMSPAVGFSEKGEKVSCADVVVAPLGKCR